MDDTKGRPPELQCNEERSLCRLLRVHAVFGITYFGNISFDEKLSLVKRLAIICYDLAFYGLFIVFDLRAFNDESFNRIYEGSNNKGIMSFVFRAAGLAVSAEYFIIKIMMAINGCKITRIINSLGFVKNSKEMLIIWGIMLFMATIDSMAVLINFIDFGKPLKELFENDKMDIIFFGLVGLVRSVVRSSVLSLLIYTSFVVRKQINDYTENMAEISRKSCKKFYRSMAEMRSKLDEINSCMGVMMFLKIGADSVIVSACLCSLAAGGLNRTVFVALVCHMSTSMSDIVISCRCSQFMINSMSDLCKVISNYISNQMISDNDYRQLNLIVIMKRFIRFRVLNFFDLKDVTILMIIGYVTNYAVILVQTQPKY